MEKGYWVALILVIFVIASFFIFSNSDDASSDQSADEDDGSSDTTLEAEGFDALGSNDEVLDAIDAALAQI